MLLKKEEVVKVFQNINETEKTREETNKKNLLANVVSKKYIILYILTFTVSMVTKGYDVSPFSFAIIAACIANEIPIIAIILIALVGNIVGARVEKYFKLHNYIVNIFCKFSCKRTNIQ